MGQSKKQSWLPGLWCPQSREAGPLDLCPHCPQTPQARRGCCLFTELAGKGLRTQPHRMGRREPCPSKNLAPSPTLLSETKRRRCPDTLPAKEQCSRSSGLMPRGYWPDGPSQGMRQPGLRKAQPAALLFSTTGKMGEGSPGQSSWRG